MSRLLAASSPLRLSALCLSTHRPRLLLHVRLPLLHFASRHPAAVGTAGAIHAERCPLAV
jgi:hypothetical protein